MGPDLRAMPDRSDPVSFSQNTRRPSPIQKPAQQHYVFATDERLSGGPFASLPSFTNEAVNLCDNFASQTIEILPLRNGASLQLDYLRDYDIVGLGHEIISPDQDKTEYSQWPTSYSTMQFNNLDDAETQSKVRFPSENECEDWTRTLPSIMPPSCTSPCAGSAFSARYDSFGQSLQDHLNAENLATCSGPLYMHHLGDVRSTLLPVSNAWQTLIVPMALKCETFVLAAKSSACFLGSSVQAGSREEGSMYMKLANQKFAFDRNGVTHISAVATSLLLASLQPWEEGSVAANKYLRGAKILTSEVLTGQLRSVPEGIEHTRLKVLYNTWLCMDVVFRLTCLSDAELGDFTETLLINAGYSVYDSNLDPLGGCIPSLFSIIGQAAELTHWVRSGAVTSSQMVPQAMKIWLLLEKWSPPAFVNAVSGKEDPLSQEVMCITEAYRLSAFLFLSQTVPELDSPPINSLAINVLRNLAAVHVQLKTATLQVFPLLAASIEVKDVENRRWVMSRWRAIGRVRTDLGLAADRCVKVVNEVWRRRDAYSLQMLDTIMAMANFMTPLGSTTPISDTTTANTAGTTTSPYQYPISPYISSFTQSPGGMTHGTNISNGVCATNTTYEQMGQYPVTSIAAPGNWDYDTVNTEESSNASVTASAASASATSTVPTTPDIIDITTDSKLSISKHDVGYQAAAGQVSQARPRSCRTIRQAQQQQQKQQPYQNQKPTLDPAYTVCGPLHWVTVMKEWKWDGFCILPWE